MGTGLAGASAAASLGEMGFRVFNFCIQDSPRRAHSIAAQGGINAAKNYQNDGDSVYLSLIHIYIPIILLTAKDSLQDKEEGYEVGADSYLKMCIRDRY